MYQPPGDASEVYVLGKQWMWEAQHPEGRREINELHVPVGRPVRLTMTSQDVIHSFYIPAFRIKQDVLPGRYTSLWFEPTKAGQVPPLLRRVLRDAALGDGRLGRRDGAGRLPAVAPVGGGQGVDGRRRASSCSSSTAAPAATARNATVRAPLLEGVYGHAGAAPGRARSSRPTSATSATRSSAPARRSSPATSRSCRLRGPDRRGRPARRSSHTSSRSGTPRRWSDERDRRRPPGRPRVRRRARAARTT